MGANRIRVCVGDPAGPRSAVWSIAWRKSDVYLIATEVAGIAKISFHLRTGEFSWSYIYEYYEANREELGYVSRHMLRWQRPQPFTPGLTLPFRIYFANEALVPAPDLPTKKQIRWIKPPRGTAVGLICIIAEPGVPYNPYQGHDQLELVASLSLSEHPDRVLLYAHYTDESSVSASANAGIISFTADFPDTEVSKGDRVYAIMDKPEPTTGSWNFIEIPTYVLEQ